MRLPKLRIEQGTGKNRVVTLFRALLVVNIVACTSVFVYDYMHKTEELTVAQQEALKLKEEAKLMIEARQTRED